MIFHTRQFDLHQEQSAMKIGTDGVLLGAWCALPHSGSVWDLGTGTGLIALMAAQRCGCTITGVEIDRASALEAAANAASSPWSDRVRIVHGDALELADTLGEADAIVSNPPYFDTTLKSPDLRRAGARHAGSLSPESLIELAAKKLSPSGRLSFIAPANQFNAIDAAVCFHRLNMQRVCMVSSREGKAPMRVLVQIGRTEMMIERTALQIRTDGGDYSPEYRVLTNDFYTHLK